MNRLLFLPPLLLLASCGGGGTDEEAAPSPTATVRTAPAELGTTSDTLDLYGAAEAGPGNERAMAVQAEAVLARIVAPTGTAVRPGEIVAILRPSPASRLEAIKAASDAATTSAAYDRARRLRADGLTGDAEVETARAAMAAAIATRARIGQRAATLTLRAPSAGTVQALTARPGDMIAAGTVVATIAGAGDLRARFGIDPSMAQRIRPGEPIQLSAIGSPNLIRATVAGVDPQVDQTTRLAAVFARVPGASGMSPGQPLHASLALGASSSGLTIPYAALLDDGGRSFVYVVRGGIARAHTVSPGNSTGDRIQVLKGLQPGERVVTEGGTALEDGMKVREEGAAAAR